MLTTTKISNGFFKCFWNGVESRYNIVNTSMGASGRGNNVYAIENTNSGTFKVVGSLQQTKKVVGFTLKKENVDV